MNKLTTVLQTIALVATSLGLLVLGCIMVIILTQPSLMMEKTFVTNIPTLLVGLLSLGGAVLGLVFMKRSNHARTD